MRDVDENLSSLSKEMIGEPRAPSKRAKLDVSQQIDKNNTSLNPSNLAIRALSIVLQQWMMPDHFGWYSTVLEERLPSLKEEIVAATIRMAKSGLHVLPTTDNPDLDYTPQERDKFEELYTVPSDSDSWDSVDFTRIFATAQLLTVSLTVRQGEASLLPKQTVPVSDLRLH